MHGYQNLAKFYDDVTGNQLESSKLIHKLIRKYHPSAKTLLDVACGTGSHLLYLSKYFESSGLDICPEMLSLACNKLPDIPLYHSDMTRFSFGKTYDVIICINDSINHLIGKNKWRKFFLNTYSNLSGGGILIFSMNTLYNLKKLSNNPPEIHQFGNNYLITKVRQKRRALYEWDLRLFENSSEDYYKLHECILNQTSVTVSELRSLMKGLFSKTDLSDSRLMSINPGCRRIFCTAVK